MLKGLRRYCGMVAALLMFAAPAQAQEAETQPYGFAQPDGRVILTVSGLPDGDVDFDRNMLEAIGTTSFQTKTPWTDTADEYEGVLLRDLAERLNLSQDTHIKVRALNNYSADMTIAEGYQWDVLLAMKSNGKRLHVRDKGPIWVIFPVDEAPEELKTLEINGKMVWQLREIIVVE